MALDNDKDSKGAPNNAGSSGDASSSSKERRRKRRWGEVKPSQQQQQPTATTSAATTTATGTAASNRVLALQESIRARLAAAKAKQQQQQAGGAAAAVAPTVASGGTAAGTITGEARPAKRAKQYKLDLSVTAPTFASSSSTTQGGELKTAPKKQKQKKKSDNPYLAHLEEPDDDDDDQAAAANGSAAAANGAASDEFVDERLQRVSKPRTRHKEFKFVEEGHWQQVAAAKREKAAAAAAAGYASGRKTGHTIHSITMGATSSSGDGMYGPSSAQDVLGDSVTSPSQLAPRADAHTDTNMPLSMEWWDVELLPSKLKKQVASTESQALSKQTKAALKQQLLEDDPKEKEAAPKDVSNEKDQEGAAETSKSADNGDDETKAISPSSLSDLRTRCWEQAALRYSKTATLVQHIVPVQPPNLDSGPAKQPVLHLTKKELRRQRKLRREEKRRELQDLQAAGLIDAPEPRLTLSNFIQVLGDQAFVDPSQMEQKVLDQIQARQKAHLDRNQANKLTKEQRSAKRARKLYEDTSTGVTVALFYVKDASHPYHRALLDLNAQQNSLSGGVLEVPSIGVACVIVEGGPKAIQRYKRLLLVRMKWTGPPNEEDDDDDDAAGAQGDDTGEYKTQKFNPDNTCELVWQGMAVKALFQGFVFQHCETSAQARKILKTKGVEHYWDQVLRHASGQDQGLQLKLTDAASDNEEDDNPYRQQEDDDIVMKE